LKTALIGELAAHGEFRSHGESEEQKMMKAAQFQIAGVDFPECPARDSLRAAQAKLKAAKACR
jgi:hypothetical protein